MLQKSNLSYTFAYLFDHTTLPLFQEIDTAVFG